MNVETETTQALGALELVTGQRDRLRAYALTIASLVYLAAGPEREVIADELLARARARCLQSGDLEEAV